MRPEDHILKPPRQAVVKTTTLPNGQKHEEEIDLLTDFSWRNFFATINFAKIMQKLSKHRSHRIRMMVQYKSSVSMFSISDSWRRLDTNITTTGGPETNTQSTAPGASTPRVETY